MEAVRAMTAHPLAVAQISGAGRRPLGNLDGCAAHGSLFLPQAAVAVRAAFAQEVARKMDQYVPFDTGTLKNSVHLASDYQQGVLIYNTPYARRQYYLHPMGEGVKDDDKGGHRGSYWGQRCDADFHPYFVRFAKRAVKKELNR